MSYHSSRGKYYDTLNTQSQEYIYNAYSYYSYVFKING